jgi:small basic protein (TIGR04137 family)
MHPQQDSNGRILLQPCQNGRKTLFFVAELALLQSLTITDRVDDMTMDRSLKVQAGAIRNRNVLTRAERIARLKELDKFDEEKSVVGMPKVRVQKVSLKKKKKVKKVDEETAE